MYLDQSSNIENVPLVEQVGFSYVNVLSVLNIHANKHIRNQVGQTRRMHLRESQRLKASHQIISPYVFVACSHLSIQRTYKRAWLTLASPNLAFAFPAA